ncbi:unnamed protein product, partial [Discosporangium mesarthrocarpum]
GGSGAVDVFDRGTVEFQGKNFFEDNFSTLGTFPRHALGINASHGGHVLAEAHGIVAFHKSSKSYFEDGKADFRGAIAAIDKGELIIKGKAEFKRNVARDCGGAIAADKGGFKDKSKKLRFKNNEDK